MDKKIFVKNLKDLSNNVIKEGKKYSKIWLSEANFGGYYHSGGYILNVKAGEHFESTSPETKYLVHILFDRLDNETRSYFHRVAFYNDNEPIPEEKGDILLYEEE